MICFVQVILEHLPFVSEPILVCAFETERVLVDGRVVGPSHSLSLGQTWEMVFHRHETEVRGHSSPNSHCVCVPLFDISYCNCDVIAERERANLVVQLAPFFCIYIIIYPTSEATYRNVLRSSKYASHEKDILHHALHWI